MLRYVVLLCLLVQVSRAIVCTPQLCAGVEQKPLDCPGGIIEGGGFCGCTDICAKVKGDPCDYETGSGFGIVMRPKALMGKCNNGLICVNGKCQ